MPANTEHDLFKTYPLVSTRNTSAGELPVPYHAYDGVCALIGATADISAVSEALQNQQVKPIQTSDGKALMAVWVCEFTEASLGQHSELQFAILCSFEDHAPVTAHPLALLKLLAFDPSARMFCHGLWNNSPQVVAYNSEVLGLGAQLSQSTVNYSATHIGFEFSDMKTEQALLSGEFNRPPRTGMSAGLSMLGYFGFGGVMRLGNMPWITAQVVNRVGAVIPHNANAQAHLAADSLVVQLVDNQTGSFEIEHPVYASWQITPQFVEHMNGFKFVYLNPHDVGDQPR